MLFLLSAGIPPSPFLIQMSTVGAFRPRLAIENSAVCDNNIRWALVKMGSFSP